MRPSLFPSCAAIAAVLIEFTSLAPLIIIAFAIVPFLLLRRQIVWRLGPMTLCTLSIAAFTPELRALSWLEIALIALSACVATVAHQCAHAWRRQYLFAPVADDATADPGRDEEARGTLWRIGVTLSAVFAASGLLMLPENALQLARELLENTVTEFQARVLTMACVLAIAAWRGHADYQRAKEDVPTHVAERRQRAMASVRQFALLFAPPFFIYQTCVIEHISLAASVFFAIRLCFVMCVIFQAPRRTTLMCAMWAVVVVSSFYLLFADASWMRLRLPIATCFAVHYILVRVRESRVSFGLHSLCVCVICAWAGKFDTDGNFLIGMIFVVAGVAFTEKAKLLADIDREQAVAAAKRQSDAAIAAAVDTAKVAEAAEAAAMDAVEVAEARLATAADDAEEQAHAIELYACAIDVAGKGIVITDAQQRVKHVNITWCTSSVCRAHFLIARRFAFHSHDADFSCPIAGTLTGYTRAESVGREGGTRFLQGPQTDTAAVHAMRSAIREGKPFSGVVRNYKKVRQASAEHIS